MKLFSYTSLCYLVLHTAIATGQPMVNIIALENGSKIIQAPTSMVTTTEREILAKYTPGALFDQSPKVWSSKKAVFPMEFVVELTEEYHLRQLIFDNRCEFYPGIETKKVRVETSLDDATSGYAPIGEYELKKEALNEFSIPPTKARWVKLIILENHGNKERVQLAEFKAMGTPANRLQQTINIDGMWHTNWQDITFEQEGNSFTGSYVYTSGSRRFKGKVKDGKINRNSIEFYWDEGKIEGTAKLYVNQEGNQLSGLWHNAFNPRNFNLWTMTRSKEDSKPIEYSEPIPAEEYVNEDKPNLITIEETPQEVAAAEPVQLPAQETPAPTPPPAKPPTQIGGTEIKAGNTIILKNVFFELGKSTVTANSHAELDKLVEYLQAVPGSKVKINGHTDRIGDRKKNLILSQQRADAIKDYLIENGIDKKRITTEGKGDTETICSPPCKENRRVDFVLTED